MCRRQLQQQFACGCTAIGARSPCGPSSKNPTFSGVNKTTTKNQKLIHILHIWKMDYNTKIK